MRFRTSALFLLVYTLSFKSSFGQTTTDAKLNFDHLLFFVSDPSIKDSLDQLFAPAEKLTTEHYHQGTIGYYYLFYNTYIELLFLEDSGRVKENSKRFGSDYLRRWSEESRCNPISFGMIMDPWDTSAIEMSYHIYQSKDAPEEEYYIMSAANRDLSQPFIYVSQPHRAHKPISSMEDIQNRPEEIREDLRNYLTHPTQVQRLSRIIYTTPEKEHEGNLKIIEENEAIRVEESDMTSITLLFDDGKGNSKSLMINQEVKLIIRY